MDSDFMPRLVIGVVGGIAILLSNFLHPEPLYFILAIFWCFSFIELTALLGLKSTLKDWFLLTSAYLFILIFYLLSLSLKPASPFWVILVSILWLLAILYIYFGNPLRSVSRIISYSLYLTFPYTFMIFIRKQYGSNIFLLLLLTVWTMDVFSYFFGKLWGCHLIAPKISPKKTWEGTFFGVLVSGLVVLFGFSWLGYKTSLLIWISALLLPVFGFLGDLFESTIKRRYSRKDSGELLHGHGGFLDRFDSMLFVTVAFGVLLWFL